MFSSDRSRLRRGLLIVHLIAMAAVLGSDLGLLTLGLAAATGGMDVSIAYPAAQAIALRLLWPMALLLILSGVGLALVSRRNLVRETWLTAKLAIAVLLTAAIIFLLLPRLQAAAVAAALAEPPSAKPLLIAPSIASALLVVALVLAVAKPGAGRRPAAIATDRTRGRA
jgi:uncharacterized membrane protein